MTLWSQERVKAAEDKKLSAYLPSASGMVMTLRWVFTKELKKRFSASPPAALRFATIGAQAPGVHGPLTLDTLLGTVGLLWGPGRFILDLETSKFHQCFTSLTS